MPSGPRADRLDRAAFTEGLLRFVAEHGLDELSMRSLGGELGVSHMAVYHHFPGGREELIRVTTDNVVAQIRLPQFRGDGVGWLVDLGVRLRSTELVSRRGEGGGCLDTPCT